MKDKKHLIETLELLISFFTICFANANDGWDRHVYNDYIQVLGDAIEIIKESEEKNG